MTRVTFEDAPPLPGWLARDLPFHRRLATIDGRRVHFIDAGRGPAVYLQHGNPTWGYLWRKVLPPLLEAGLRVIVPDLLGLGLSDKLPRPGDHTLDLHIDTLAALIGALDLPAFTIAGQDWGGPTSAGVAARFPDRVRGAVFGNTALLVPKDPSKSTAFHRFSHVPLLSDVVFTGLGGMIPTLPFVQGDRASIGPHELRAYWWPLRRLRDRAGPLGLARMVPGSADHPSLRRLAEVDAWAKSFRGPVSLVWGMKDPILGRASHRLRQVWPEATVHETGAGHFLQEEVPDLLAREIKRVALGHP